MNTSSKPPHSENGNNDTASAFLEKQVLKVCIAGSGAIGGTLAVRLAAKGHDVSVIARGEQLLAIRKNGLALTDVHGTTTAWVRADSVASFGVQDVVFISVKSHGLSGILPAIIPLLGEHTIVVPTVNGIPWWYFVGEAGEFGDSPVAAVDPSGALLSLLPPWRIIGSVVYITAEVPRPGFIYSAAPHRIVLGELDGTPRSRLAVLCRRLGSAGIEAGATDRIRDAVWAKLMANLSSNPLSVVTGERLGTLCSDPHLVEISVAIMDEVRVVGEAYGVRFGATPMEVVKQGRRLGAFRTSMLQDFEMGRPLELAAIGDAVVELAARRRIPVPTVRAVVSLARFKAESAAR